MGRGKLLFKGDKSSKHKKKSSSKKHSSSNKSKSSGTDTGEHSHSSNYPEPEKKSSCEIPSSHNAAQQQQDQQQQEQQTQIHKGAGLIISSGTIVTGYDESTNFTGEFSTGDALIVAAQEKGGEQEMRVVTMRLSNSSCAVSSAFSHDLKTPTEFYYIQKPRDARAEAQKRREDASKAKAEEERCAFGTYGTKDKNEFIYREKTETGSYTIRTEKLDGEVSRGDLLFMRSKKKSDKYC